MGQHHLVRVLEVHFLWPIMATTKIPTESSEAG